MSVAAVAQAPTVSAVAAAGPRPSETKLAAAHLTPASRVLLPDSLLDAKVGRSTLAGSLNDQVRFRVERVGTDVKDWKVLADSPTATALVQSEAGAALLRQLSVAIGTTGSLGKVSNLKGFILAEDTESVLAGIVLSTLDVPTDPDGRQLARLGELGRTTVAGRVMRTWGDGLATQVARAGAWNAEGWITFMPDTSRAMLVAAGAYRPNRTTEKGLLKAAKWTDYITGNASHEVQHSVSDPSPTAYQGKAKWMEEGTANVFSRTPVFKAQHAKAAGLNKHAYAARLGQQPKVDLGWSDWKRPHDKKSEQDYKKETGRNYDVSQVVLRDLTKLAGADYRTTAGRELAFQLLQAKSMRFTAGVLADAIIAHNHLDPKVRERLRTAIAGAVDLKGGAAELAKQFGITS